MNAKPAVLLVDHNARNVELLSAFLQEAGYPTRGLSSITDLDDFLANPRAAAAISLALIDLTGFDAAIWDRCRAMHDARIGFVIIARAQSEQAEWHLRRDSHGAGARYTITKPLRKEQLLTLVRILTGTDD